MLLPNGQYRPDLDISPPNARGIRWLRSGRDLWRQQKVLGDASYLTLAGWRFESCQAASWAWQVMVYQNGEEDYAAALARLDDDMRREQERQEQQRQRQQRVAQSIAAVVKRVEPATTRPASAVILPFRQRARA